MEKVNNYFPYCSAIQKVILYETKQRFYIVGTDQSESKFRVLKIDRTEGTELIIVEDPAKYNGKEIKELLATLSAGSPSGTPRNISAFGILGFLKLLDGYYIILITRRRKVATIGHHAVYKIEDTTLVYIPTGGPSKNPDEIRYLKLFQSIDLSSNFYFSYSYDLTNNLQYNMCPPKDLIEPIKKSHSNLTFAGFLNVVNQKFVWNSQLLKPIESSLHPDWILHITHGFIAQSNVSIYGKPVYMCLIARRSTQYAGTRFLKRGADFEGNTANEVETEQIVFDSSTSSFTRGEFTAFTQMRGSIPAHWSQDISKMVPKPPIGLDIPDPYAETAGKHFGSLLHRFGSPIVVLNLVKKKERRRHESILTTEYLSAINTLNQFLPPRHRIHYIGFDMARTNKTKEKDVMSKLARISEEIIRRTGFFISSKKDKSINDLFGQRQTGLARVNCVDCLDRTNTAQFALGKCALAHQFRALGLLGEDEELEFESDVIRMLEELYEDHGDTLALQYGGSQLVHRINTYRKTAPWTSQGNDIMQTLSRYFSNTFSDAEKQNAINLFLGKYIPSQEPFPLWTLENDIQLHLKPQFRFLKEATENIPPLTEWYSDEVLSSLPHSSHELSKRVQIICCDSERDIDTFDDFYRPHELLVLSDVFGFKISHSVRDFMPNSTVNYSPFVVRARPGKRQEESTGKKSNKLISLKNPSIMSLSSHSNASTSSESEYSSSEEINSFHSGSVFTSVGGSKQTELEFKKLFSTMEDSYGVKIKRPDHNSLILYKKFVQMQQSMISSSKTGHSLNVMKTVHSIPLSGFSKDSSYSVTPPAVSKISRDIYKNYVERGTKGASEPSKRDMDIYKNYVSKSGNPSLLVKN